MITFAHKGDFSKTRKFFERIKEAVQLGILDKYGRKGVEALKEATPVDTGETAASWYYTIEHDKAGSRIYWSNSNIENGYHIAILLQYGHGTGTGGYVQGTDYINPAITPVFEDLADAAWKEITKL